MVLGMVVEPLDIDQSNIQHCYLVCIIGTSTKSGKERAPCVGQYGCQNDVIFNNILISTPMQVVFRGTHWIRQWPVLQKEENMTQIK